MKQLLVLGIDTSTRVAGVALAGDGGAAFEKRIFEPLKTHSQKLMPALDELLRDKGVSLKDISAVAVSQGPGSFTGLRIGVVTAKTLAQVLNIPLFGVDTLEALAYNVFEEETTGDFAPEDAVVSPILDAQKEEVYAALYRRRGSSLATVASVRPVALGEWLGRLKESREPVCFLGDAVLLWRERINEELGGRAFFGSEENLFPRASHVARLGREMLEQGIEPSGLLFQPVYLRRSEAERLWEKKQQESCP